MRRIVGACLVVVSAMTGAVYGEDAPPVDESTAASVPDWMDAYRLESELSAGYRTVDIDGSKAKYREDYDLRSGGRLLGLSLTGRAQDASASLVDRFRLEVDTPHDEPLSRARLLLADDRLYDLRVDFSKARYDYAVPRLRQEPVQAVRRLDDLHDFDLDRTHGSVDLAIHPTRSATILAGYRLYRRHGDAVTTRWVPGGDTFLVDEDIDSRTHVGFLGTRLTVLGTDVDVRQEFRRTDRTFEQTGPRLGEAAGLDPADGSTLTEWTGDQDERIDAPTTRVRLRRAIGDRAEITGGYVYTHAELDVDGDRVRRGTVTQPVFPASERRTHDGDATFDAHVLDLGGSVRVTDRVTLHAGYRFDERTQDADLLRTDAFGRIIADTGYHLRTHRVEGDVQAELRPDLSVRAGIRYARRDANVSTGPDPIATDAFGVLADVRYRPWRFLGLDLRYEGLQLDDPYHVPGASVGGLDVPEREIALTFVNRGSAGVRLTPVDWLSLRYRFLADSRENDSFGANLSAFGHETSVELTPLDELSMFLSWSRRDVDHSNDIRVAPLYRPFTSLQRGSEDVLIAQLAYAFELLGERWSLGSNVAWVLSDQTLRPSFEPGRSQTAFDLDRVDGGAFLRLHHRWIEPAVEFRMIDYDERVLPENDYRATIVLFRLTHRWSN